MQSLALQNERQFEASMTQDKLRFAQIMDQVALVSVRLRSLDCSRSQTNHVSPYRMGFEPPPKSCLRSWIDITTSVRLSRYTYSPYLHRVIIEFTIRFIPYRTVAAPSRNRLEPIANATGTNLQKRSRAQSFCFADRLHRLAGNARKRAHHDPRDCQPDRRA